jgi:tRNA pseudouridine65 synthase
LPRSPRPVQDARRSCWVDVLYHDAVLFAVNKPSGLLTHRGWANDADNALVRARSLAGCFVYPVHRLDRATSGVLLFALSSEIAAALGRQLGAGGLEKRYLALVRGIPPEHVEVDHPLAAEPGAEPKAAQTCVRRLGSFERYALVEAVPKTGRLHQVRRHMKHLSHPILGDTRYGDGKHNRACRERFALHRLALHAASLGLTHPTTAERLLIRAPLPADLCHALDAMDLHEVAAAALRREPAEFRRELTKPF